MSLFKRETVTNNVTVLPVYAEVGDTLIIESEKRMTKEGLERLKAQLGEHAGVGVIVLEGGLKIKGMVAGVEH